MKKIITITLCLILLLAYPLQAKPWYKDWKAWTVIGITLGADAAATHYSHECRVKFGPAPCEGGYGEFQAREILRNGAGVGMIALGLWGRHQGFKEWAIMPLGYAGYQTSVAVRQSRIGCPYDEHFLYGTKYTCVPNYEPGDWWKKP